MRNDFYKNKKIFITGADGFIGSHLVQELISQGADLRCLTYYNSWNNLGWLKDLSKGELEAIEIIKGDIRDPDLVRKAVADVDHIFHLSSLIAIPYSYDAPVSYVETNISGALNLLVASRDSNRLQSFLHVSTSEVYGSAQKIPINEDHPLVGQSPYSATKIASDQLSISYFRSFELRVPIPNPASNQTKIQFISGKYETIVFIIYDMLGKQIESRVISAQRGVNTIDLNINYLDEGIYMYSITNGEDFLTKRMIVTE